MLDRSEQERIVKRIAEAAAEEDCAVAPVGSVFFLFQGSGRALTKDVDAVIHGPDDEVVDLAVLKRIASRLGDHETTHDGAVVTIRTEAGREADIELVRGRRRRSGGFMPRDLLEEAARHATRDGNVLLYPLEFVLVLKADAAIDREERAARDEARRAENLVRADVFRGDVFAETRRALDSRGLNVTHIQTALECLKKKRRAAVATLLRDAGVPIA